MQKSRRGEKKRKKEGGKRRGSAFSPTVTTLYRSPTVRRSSHERGEGRRRKGVLGLVFTGDRVRRGEKGKEGKKRVFWYIKVCLVSPSLDSLARGG